MWPSQFYRFDNRNIYVIYFLEIRESYLTFRFLLTVTVTDIQKNSFYSSRLFYIILQICKTIQMYLHKQFNLQNVGKLVATRIVVA